MVKLATVVTGALLVGAAALGAYAVSSQLGCADDPGQSSNPGRGVTTATQPVKRPQDTTQYAILFAGSDCREQDGNLFHPIDKNAEWVTMGRAYDHLLKRGVAAERIFFLYKDGQPDFADSAIKDIRAELEHAFSPGYSHVASWRNFQRVERHVNSLMDSNDALIVAIGTHGAQSGGLLSEATGEILDAGSLSDMLEDNPSPNTLLIVDACHSGNCISKITAKGTLVSSSNTKTTWIDRKYGFTEMMLRSLNDPSNDRNKDGRVDYREGFHAADSIHFHEGEAKRPFIDGPYMKSLPLREQVQILLYSDDMEFKGRIIENK